jgi:hypothetical protein
MKVIYKKFLSIILVSAITLMIIPMSAFAAFKDVPDGAIYADSLDRLSALGVITSNASEFKPNDLVTKEQFAKMIVVAAGLEETSEALKGTSQFSDLAAGSWSCGYINVALNQGYITGDLDGNFHPKSSLTYAQICTIIVRALGYTSSSDVPGQWPINYISKASSLGLTKGINLKKGDSVPRWVAALMIDRMLDTDAKAAAGTTAQKFIDVTNYFNKAIVLGNPATDSSLSSNQVITDKGIYLNSCGAALTLGDTYYISVKDGEIKSASTPTAEVQNISVSQSNGYQVSYLTKATTSSMTLPANIKYYYKGSAYDYSKIPDILVKNSSIVLTYNENKTTFEYGVIFDPVYSDPEVADTTFISTKKIGAVSFADDPLIIRNGKVIDITDIKAKDIVYMITDIWGANKYIQVYNDKVGGKITGILPNKLTPKTLQIDSVDYEISDAMNISKIASSYGNFSVGNNIIVSLGYQGKIVNIENFGAEDNSNYALVLDNGEIYEKNDDGTKTLTYTAKLLFTAGFTGTYNVNSATALIKGALVTYRQIDSHTLELTPVEYGSTGTSTIYKEKRMLDRNYVNDNVKIINLVYDDSDEEYVAKVLSWSDLPNGQIPAGKIRYVNKTGVFDDINLIYTNDILNERYKVGIVSTASKSGSSNAYSILINGKKYDYSKYITGAVAGSIYQFKMNSTGIESMVQSLASFVSSHTVQAVDSRRIKINDTIYYFDSDITLYHMDADYNITLGTLADIDVNETYDQVALYTNGSIDSDIQMIIIKD